MLIHCPKKLNDYYDNTYTGFQSGDKMLGVGYEVNGKIVCCMLYEKYTGTDITVHVAIDYPHPIWVRECIHLLFNVLGVRRISAPIRESNTKAVRFAKALGAVLECTIVDAFPDDNMLLFVVWESNSVIKRLRKIS